MNQKTAVMIKKLVSRDMDRRVLKPFVVLAIACAFLIPACSTNTPPIDTPAAPAGTVSDISIDTPSPQVDLVCNTPQLYANKVVGDGHCVSLIKKCALAPITKKWRAGKSVLSFADQLPLGTIIATFENGRYPNRAGHHAAIYISHDRSGIWVWDQWRGKAVHRRYIRVRKDRATASNSARAYRLVTLLK